MRTISCEFITEIPPINKLKLTKCPLSQYYIAHCLDKLMNMIRCEGILNRRNIKIQAIVRGTFETFEHEMQALKRTVKLAKNGKLIKDCVCKCIACKPNIYGQVR